MLRRFIVFSTSRSIGFRSTLKHFADGHKAGRPQIRGSMLFGRGLPTTHPLPLIHGASARSVGSSLRGKATPVCPHVESHELPALVEHTSKNAPQAELRPVLINSQIGCQLSRQIGKHVFVLCLNLPQGARTLRDDHLFSALIGAAISGLVHRSKMSSDSL
jgi:hypothetical protein